MKRFVSLLLSAVLLLGLFAGCRKEPAVGTQTPEQWPGAAELAEAVFSRSGFDGDTNGLERLSADKDEAVFLSDYLVNAYGLEDPWRDAAVVRGTGMSAFEVAVVRMEDEEAAARAAGALADYRADRRGDFAGYAPAEAVRIELNTGVSPAIIVPTDDKDNFLYMVLPVRLKNSD